ncbi:MAG: hypothetical protein Q7U71_03055 [bacterium]|nr:hypothetical protein [bacterium]
MVTLLTVAVLVAVVSSPPVGAGVAVGVLLQPIKPNVKTKMQESNASAYFLLNIALAPDKNLKLEALEAY